MSGFHLNLSLMTPGHYRHAWRLPHSDPTAYLDVDYFVRLAKIAEDAGIDAVFLGDAPALRGGDRGRARDRYRPPDPARARRRSHPQPRGDHHLVVDLQLPVQPGSSLPGARHRHQGPGGGEHRHHRHQRRGRQLRSRRPPRQGDPLPTGLGVPRRGHPAVGRLAARLAGRRQGDRPVRRHREDPTDRPRGRVLLGGRSAAGATRSAGPAGDRPVRRLRRRAPAGRRLRRCRLHRGADPGQGRRLPRRHPAAGRGRRARPRPGQGLAGRRGPGGRDRGRSPAACRGS